MLLLCGCGEEQSSAAQSGEQTKASSAAETTAAAETTDPADTAAESDDTEISPEVLEKTEAYRIGDTGISLLLPKDWKLTGYNVGENSDWIRGVTPIIKPAGDDFTLKLPGDRARWHMVPPGTGDAGAERRHDMIDIRIDRTHGETDLAAYAEKRVPGGDISEAEEVVLETEDGREYPGKMLGYAGTLPTFPDSAVYGVCFWCDLPENGCSLFVCLQYDGEENEPLLDAVLDSITVES